MAGKKKLYGPQFKQEACRLVTGQGYSAAEAARQLGIPHVDVRLPLRVSAPFPLETVG